jgi:pimeloyl-ACP methyl ester carboxylesterase
VSPQIHSEAITKMLPRAKLIVLSGIGHMLHHAAAGVMVDAIDEIASGTLSPAAKN